MATNGTKKLKQKIKRFLAQQPQVKISVEMILEYIHSGKLPTVTRDDGLEMSFIFHPEAATEFALLWVACWLSHNPSAEISTAEAWAEAVVGGNQHIAKHRQVPPKPTKEELETQKRESEIRENLKDLLMSALEKAEADIDKDKVLGALIQACVIYTPRAGASYKSMVQRVREYWPWEHATNGIIFEFKELEQAKAFAVAVKEKWTLDSRVFDNVEEAELAHLYPFGQEPPVVHVDRPNWFLDDNATEKELDQAWAKEEEIQTLAEKTFGGKYVGT